MSITFMIQVSIIKPKIANYNTKYAITVLGDLSPSQLGKTLTHEHVSMEFFFSYKSPKASELHLVNCDWTLNNSGWIQQWP